MSEIRMPYKDRKINGIKKMYYKSGKRKYDILYFEEGKETGS